MKISNRIHKLRQQVAKKNIEAIFISQPENRYYLSGFNGTAGFLLITADRAILATDFRYIEQAGIQAPDYEISRIDGEITRWFPGLLDGLSISRLGFEAGHVSFGLHRQLKNALHKKQSPVRLAPTEGLVESLRAIKEAGEIEYIKKAAAIADAAFDYIEGEIQAGMTEKQIAWQIEKCLRENGSETIPFEIIVASGPNAALPHARPSERIIQPGEPVVIDMGAKYKGYGSDLSRTICLGKPEESFRKIYRIVLDAQLTAMSIISEGTSGQQADSAARKVIEKAGYGKAFGHALGHGVGLAPHESPRLGPNSNEKLVSGMVFTVEPGIYLPGWGGVRIEDIVVMNNKKVEVVSKARKVLYD